MTLGVGGGKEKGKEKRLIVGRVNEVDFNASSVLIT
jgi:hypothetical protein